MGTVAAVVAGTVAGVTAAWVGLLIMGPPSSNAADLPKPDKATTRATATVPLTEKVGPVFAAAPVSEQQCAPASARSVERTKIDVPPSRPTEEDFARKAASEREAHRARIVAHEQEPRDRTWAREREAELSAGFGELSHATTATLQKLECRSVSCLASFSWPDEVTARQQMHELIAGIAPKALGASRFITLQPSDGNGPTTASMILDWTEADDVSMNKQ